MSSMRTNRGRDHGLSSSVRQPKKTCVTTAKISTTRDLPPLDSYVSQLPSLDKLLLRVALALKPAHGHEIDMLIMDDLEQVHSFTDREFLLHTLDRLAERMTVVVNSVNPIDDCVQPRAVIELNTNQSTSSRTTQEKATTGISTKPPQPMNTAHHRMTRWHAKWRRKEGNNACLRD